MRKFLPFLLLEFVRNEDLCETRKDICTCGREDYKSLICRGKEGTVKKSSNINFKLYNINILINFYHLKRKYKSYGSHQYIIRLSQSGFNWKLFWSRFPPPKVS